MKFALINFQKTLVVILKILYNKEEQSYKEKNMNKNVSKSAQGADYSFGGGVIIRL
jgi:hypothetical protein